MRLKYQTLTTPWGDINLNGDQLISKATEIRDRIIEKLKRRPPDTMGKVI